MKKTFRSSLLVFLVLFLLAGCGQIQNQTGTQEPDPTESPLSLGENITVADSLQTTPVEEMTVYTFPREMLDPELFIGTAITEEDPKVNALASEGVAIVSGTEDYLNITVNDFLYYRGFFLRGHGSGYDEYEDILSMISIISDSLKNDLRYYGYAPEEYLADDGAQEVRDLAAQGVQFMSQIGMTVEEAPWRVEYIDSNVFSYLGVEADNYSISDFYRMFWNFQVDGVPVLGAGSELVRNVDPADSTAALLHRPYVEMVMDQNGILDVFGWGCVSNPTPSETVTDLISPEAAMTAFSDTFQDLAPENAVAIQNLSPVYLTIREGDTFILQPAWLVEYLQNGAVKEMAVDMQSGEVF